MKRAIYDDDHEAFRSSVKEFLDRDVVPHLEEHADNHGLPREFWTAAGKQGFLGLEVPEEYGGSEAGDYRFNAVLTEELAKVNMTLPSCVGIHSDIVAPYLVHLTNDEQRRRWLPGFCSGEVLTAIGMTEPSGGSDLAALKTTAVRDGDDWIINGSKTFITNGGSADLVVAFLSFTLTTYVRFRDFEARYTKLARRLALDEAGPPQASEGIGEQQKAPSTES